MKHPPGHKIQNGMLAFFAVDDVEMAYPHLGGKGFAAAKRGQKAKKEKNTCALHDDHLQFQSETVLKAGADGKSAQAGS
jgi:hypothetical protein